jgi:hypothetical protein
MGHVSCHIVHRNMILARRVSMNAVPANRSLLREIVEEIRQLFRDVRGALGTDKVADRDASTDFYWPRGL